MIDGARAILLDLDNTLYPYAPCHAAGLTRARRRFAAMAPGSAPAARFDRAYLAARRVVAARHRGTAASHHRLLYFRELCDRAWGRPAPREALVLTDAYWAGYFSAMRLDPSVKPLLRAWRRRGLKLAVISDLLEEIQLRKLAALGLAGAFDAVVTSEAAGCEKPNPRIFRAALSRLGVAPDQAVMIGDDYPKDIVGAKRLGLRTIWVARPASPEGDRRAADVVVSSLRDLQGRS